MKFFTRDLWNGIQLGGEEARPFQEEWERRVQEYWEQYRGIRSQLPDEVREFFDQPRLHDGRLLSLRVDTLRPRENAAPTVTMDVLHPEKDIICVLEYAGVRSLDVTTPEGDDLRRGIDDWGYDEISRVDALLRHEVMFASGLELTIVCRQVRITSRQQAVRAWTSGA